MFLVSWIDALENLNQARRAWRWAQDALMTAVQNELAGSADRRTIEDAFVRLEESAQILEGIREQIPDLCEALASRSDLLALQINKEEFLEQIASRGVEKNKLRQVGIILEGAGLFPAALEYLNLRLGELGELSWDLKARTEMLRPEARRGEIHLVIEENRSGNALEEFFGLQAAWARFDEDLSIFSLLAAQLWYERGEIAGASAKGQPSAQS